MSQQDQVDKKNKKKKRVLELIREDIHRPLNDIGEVLFNEGLQSHRQGIYTFLANNPDLREQLEEIRRANSDQFSSRVVPLALDIAEQVLRDPNVSIARKLPYIRVVLNREMNIVSHDPPISLLNLAKLCKKLDDENNQKKIHEVTRESLHDRTTDRNPHIPPIAGEVYLVSHPEKDFNEIKVMTDPPVEPEPPKPVDPEVVKAKILKAKKRRDRERVAMRRAGQGLQGKWPISSYDTGW